MNAYNCKTPKLTGESYEVLERKARKIHKEIAARTKRNAYIRSAYFKNDKVFVDLFWTHLHQKGWKDRRRRLKYYAAAIEVLRHSTVEPDIKPNPNGKNGEIVYRFSAKCPDGELFYVQVKQDVRSGNKHFMSVFRPN